jgi:parallel beta-helix repeat protein
MKGFTVGIILLFVGTCIIPTIAQDVEKASTPFSRGNWLYVGGSGPGNYTKIQDAIDNASDGDTVFVYDDSSPYYENLFVNKSIQFFGEKKETTIIDAGGHGNGIFLSADNVTITGFTIENSDIYHSGINMSYSNYSKIYSNIFNNNTGCGLSIRPSTNNNIISDNVFIHNYGGILSSRNFGNLIVSNYIVNNKWIGIECGNQNTIVGNTISSNGVYGMIISGLSENSNLITRNYISNHSFGIHLNSKTNSTVFNNTVIDNEIGIGLEGSKNNIINNYIINSSVCGLYCDLSAHDNIISNNSFFNNGIINSDPNRNEFYDNEVNGKPLIYLRKVTGQVIENAGQIILVDCNDITIQNLNLSHATRGLMLYNSDNCKVSGNNFSYNNVGIFLSYSGQNSFTENNFIKNVRDVSFFVDYLEFHSNIWIRNYFDNKIPFLPKIMIGTVKTRFTGYFPDSYIYRPGFYFDWFPTKKPYDIGG